MQRLANDHYYLLVLNFGHVTSWQSGLIPYNKLRSTKASRFSFLPFTLPPPPTWLLAQFQEPKLARKKQHIASWVHFFVGLGRYLPIYFFSRRPKTVNLDPNNFGTTNFGIRRLFHRPKLISFEMASFHLNEGFNDKNEDKWINRVRN